MNKKPSTDNRKLEEYLRGQFGGAPCRYFRHTHETLPLTIDVMWAADEPERGLASVVTLGLSDHPLPDVRGGEFPIRVELLALVKNVDKDFANVLAGAAFAIMRSSRLWQRGDVMKDYVREYFPKARTPHLYLTAPFPWEREGAPLPTLRCDAKTVGWLMGVPITDAEADLLRDAGDDAFEEQFARHAPDITDLAGESFC